MTALLRQQSQFEIHQITTQKTNGLGVDSLPFRGQTRRRDPTVMCVAADAGVVWVCIDEQSGKLRQAGEDESPVAGFSVVNRAINPVLAMIVRGEGVLVDALPALRLAILTTKSSLVLGTACRCFVTKRITPHVGPPMPDMVEQKLKCGFCGIPITDEPDPESGLVTRVITHECGAVYHFETVESHPGVPASDLLSCRDKVRNCLVCQRPISTDDYGKKKFGAVMAAVIAAHHVGLAELLTEEDCVRAIQTRFGSEPNEFTETDSKLVGERFRADGFSLTPVARGFTPAFEFHAADMLNVRMLFSALVDADFIETEAHFEGDRTTPRRYRADGPTLDIEKALQALNRHLDIVRRDAVPGPMDELRQQLFDECVSVGSSSPTGTFALAAPTGAGKTLAMLAFALHHARKHNLRRIVLVMPFLNIIEQTARIYRSIFSSDARFPAIGSQFLLVLRMLFQLELIPIRISSMRLFVSW